MLCNPVQTFPVPPASIIVGALFLGSVDFVHFAQRILCVTEDFIVVIGVCQCPQDIPGLLIYIIDSDFRLLDAIQA